MKKVKAKLVLSASIAALLAVAACNNNPPPRNGDGGKGSAGVSDADSNQSDNKK